MNPQKGNKNQVEDFNQKIDQQVDKKQQEQLNKQQQELADIEKDLKNNQEENNQELQDRIDVVQKELNTLGADSSLAILGRLVQSLQNKATQLEQQIIESEKKKLKEAKNQIAKKIEKEVEGKKEKKGFFGRTIDWVKGTENEEYHMAKAVGRGALVGTGVYLAFKGVQSLWKGIFGGKKDKKESTKNEDEGFWDSGIGKTLKWLGLGGLGVAVISQWDKIVGWFKGDKKPETDDSSEDQVTGYENFIKNPENKEESENYEDFGNQVDMVYETIYGRELSSGWQDDGDMEEISKKVTKGKKKYLGVVPFCLDNKYGSVEEILGQNAKFKNILAGGISEMKRYISGRTSEQLKVFLSSYLDKLPSWGPFKKMGGSLLEKIEKWSLKNKESEKELAFFFRQGIRVQTYLFEKREQLAQKIAQKIEKTLPYTKEELLNDGKLFDKYIEKNSEYQSFLSSPIASATSILKINHILDDTIGNKVKGIIEESDKERDDVLGKKNNQKDILQIINEKEKNGENLTRQEQQLLETSCDNIIEEVDDRIINIVKEGARGAYGDLLGTNNSALKKYLETSKILPIFGEYKNKITELKGKLQRNELTMQEIGGLGDCINSMLALKKEALIGANTIEKDIDENGNIVYRFPGFLRDSVNNLVTAFKKAGNLELLSATNYLMSAGFGTGILITIGGVVFGIKTGKFGAAKFGVKIAVLPATVPYEIGKRIKYGRRLGVKIKYLQPNRLQSMTLFNGEKGPQKFMEEFTSGKIKLSEAESIVNKKINGFWSGNSQKRWASVFNIETGSGGDVKNINFKEKILDKFIDHYRSGGIDLSVELKKEQGLYKKVIENFDNSQEIREALRNNKPIKEVKQIVERVDSKNYKNLKKLLERTNILSDKQVQKLLENSEEILKKTKYLSEDELAKVMKQASKLGDGEDILGFFKLQTGRKSLGINTEKLSILGRLETEIKALSDTKKYGGKVDEIKKAVKGLSELSDVSVISKLCSNTDEIVDMINFSKKFKNIDDLGTFMKGLAKSDNVDAFLGSYKALGSLDEIKNIKFVAKYIEKIDELKNLGKIASNLDEFMKIAKMLTKIF